MRASPVNMSYAGSVYVCLCGYITKDRLVAVYSLIVTQCV